MTARALLVWFVLLVLAFANGTLRELVIIPQLGETAGRAISSVLLSAAILILSWFTIAWMHPVTTEGAWKIGVVWVTLTLAFEFLVGHYLFGNPWPELLADYNVLAGRIWVLVLFVTLIAPFMTARAHGLLRAS